MDKATFLAALQRNIGMLDDGEQKDIIDEYAQHIDMKVSQGMTEEEAIKDFGEFQDFVREVLDAYHVKAPFDQEGNPAADSASLQNDSAPAGATEEGTAAAFKNAFGKLAESATDAAGKAAGQLKAAAQAHSANAGNHPAGPEGASEGNAANRQSPQSGFFVKAKAVFWTALRWAWNLFVLFWAACALVTGLFCLCGLGACIVLTILGYPAIGATLMSLGASAALFAAAYLLCKLVVRKQGTGSGAKPAGLLRNEAGSAPQAPRAEGGRTQVQAAQEATPQAQAAQGTAPQAPGIAKQEKETRATPPQMPPFPPTCFDTIPFEKVGGGKNE